MSELEITLADLWATGISPERHPVEHLRDQPAPRRHPLGRRARRTPSPAAGSTSAGWSPTGSGRAPRMGVTFLNLEDETGMLNVVCSIGVMKATGRPPATRSPWSSAGSLERNEGVTNLIADRVEGIDVVVPGAGAALQARASSRDFR